MAATKKKSTAKKTTKKAAPKKAPAKATAAKNTKKQAVKKAASAAVKKGSTKSKAAPKKAESKQTTDANKKPVSATAKETNNTWMILSIVLGIVVVLLIASIGILYTNNQSTADTNETTQNTSAPVTTTDGVNLLIIEDPTCDNCQVDLFATQVKENLISDLEFEKINFESDEGATFVESLDAKQVPIYLFSANLAELETWSEIEGAFVPVEVKGTAYMMLNPQFIPNKVLVETPKITDTAIVIGDEDAPVTVVEFTDYECPFCAIAEGNEELVEQFRGQNPTYVPPMPKILEDYVENGDVKVVFYNYPIAQLHPLARGTHNAALCANAQGKFKEYSRMIWDNREEWTATSDRKAIYMSYATELGLDEAAFETCIDEATFDSQIEAELELGATYGVSGTPAFFVGKTFISGAQDYEVFKEAIESQLNN